MGRKCNKCLDLREKILILEEENIRLQTSIDMLKGLVNNINGRK